MLGNFTDDLTLLGTALQVGLGLAGLDLPTDIRDLTYDLTHWKWSPEHVGQTLLHLISQLALIASPQGQVLRGNEGMAMALR